VSKTKIENMTFNGIDGNKLYFNFNDGNIEYAILFNKCPD